MTSGFIDTGLKLDQNGDVPTRTVVVPNLAGPNETDDYPFFTTAEPMMFRKSGSSGGVRLNVTVNREVRSAVVAPSTVDELGGKLGVEIEARRLTKSERLKAYGRAEVILAGIATLVAVFAIITAFTSPSAEQQAGRADLAAQLHPIEQRLTIALSGHDSAAAEQAQKDLEAALAMEKHESSAVSTVATVGTLLLGLLSAGIALNVVRKRSLSTP